MPGLLKQTKSSGNAGDGESYNVEKIRSEDDDGRVFVWLVPVGMEEREELYIMENTIPKSQFKFTLCAKFGFEVDETVFKYDGIEIAERDTAKSLNMIDFHIIEIYSPRVRGWMAVDEELIKLIN